MSLVYDENILKLKVMTGPELISLLLRLHPTFESGEGPCDELAFWFGHWRIQRHGTLLHQVASVS